VNDRNRNGGKGLDRVLVIDPNAANAKMMANMLRGIWPSSQIYGASSNARGLDLARDLNAQLIFVESHGPEIDGVQFCRDLRRSEFACREAPVVLVSSDTTAALILGARDAGVHEFLRRPYTMGDLQQRIDVILDKPRDWVEAVNYIGPDRRRFNSAAYTGPRKRRGDRPSRYHQINQALRIVQSAAAQVESDPMQAYRALATQARILIEAAAGEKDLQRLGAMAMRLQTYLASPAAKQALDKDQVATYAHNLVLVAPAEARPNAA
jgi:CheY-like chemotaxis protein